MLSVGDVVEYLSSLWSAGPVEDVDECGVEYHLVEWDAAADCGLCQEEGVVCCDVGGLSPDVLRAGYSSYGFVELWGAVAAVDDQWSAPCLAEGLEDAGHEEDDGLPCGAFGYGVVYAHAAGGVAALHLGPGEVLGDAVSGGVRVPVHVCLRGCVCRMAVFWRCRLRSRSA